MNLILNLHITQHAAHVVSGTNHATSSPEMSIKDSYSELLQVCTGCLKSTQLLQCAKVSHVGCIHVHSLKSFLWLG